MVVAHHVMPLSTQSQDGQDHPTAWVQQECTGEPQYIISVPQLDDKEHTKGSEATVDYYQDIDYKPEGADPNDEQDAQEEIEEENANEEYAKIEHPCQGALRQ